MKKKSVSIILAITFILVNVFSQPMQIQAATKSLYGTTEEDQGVYYLTDNIWELGTVTYNQKINTKAGATVTFSYYAQKGESSKVTADGIWAIFTNYKVGDKLDPNNGNIGKKPEKTYAVEFDSYKNTTDPKGQHIGIIHKTASNHLKYAESDKVADGKWHTAKIQVASNKITVYVDNKKIVSSKASMPKTVYLSISGYTGAYYCDQRVKSISVKQNKEKLETPEVTVSSKKKNRVVVSWEKVKNADKYVVYRSSSKRGTLELVKETSSLKFTDKNVIGGQTYYYTVLAYNEKGSYLDSALSYIQKIKVKK